MTSPGICLIRPKTVNCSKTSRTTLRAFWAPTYTNWAPTYTKQYPDDVFAEIPFDQFRAISVDPAKMAKYFDGF